MTGEALDTDVVDLRGDLDAETADAVVTRIVDETNEVQVIVDLSAVAFMDSSGRRALLEARSKLEAQTRTMILTNPTPAITRLLQAANVDEILGLSDP